MATVARATNPARPDVVLSWASGYPFVVYQRFLGSLFTSGFQGKAVIFINESDRPTVRPFAARRDVEFVTAPPSVPGLRPYLARFLAYADYLTQPGAAFGSVLLSDGRDVVFQTDWRAHPEARELAAAPPAEPRLLLFAEDVTVGQCPYNSSWLRTLDSGCLPRLADRRVLCSGTIMGNHAGVVAFLRVFAAAARAVVAAAPSPDALPVGLDQGLLNYLYHEGQLAALSRPSLRIRVLTNDDNLINTLHYGSKSVDAEGRIVNAAGAVSPIAHQWDRFPDALVDVMSRACWWDLYSCRTPQH